MGGPGLNSEGFVGLAKALSAGNQTIIYDQRGTGKIDSKPGRFIYDYHATDD